MNNMKSYRPLPWYKSIFVNFKLKISDKLANMKTKEYKRSLLRKGLILLILGLIVLTIYLLVVLNQVVVAARDPYDKTGFIEATDYISDKGNETVLENSRFRFTMNNRNTTFVLYDKVKDVSYRSNPNTTTKRFLNPIIVYYAGSLGADTALEVIANAIDYNDYLFRIDDNSIEILYEIGGKKGVDRTDFPEVITAERMEEKILSKLEEGSTDYRRVTEQVYVQGDLNGEPVWKMKDGIQASIFTHLYRIFYEVCGYTKEDLEYDLALNNIVYEDIYPYIEIAIKYTLTEEGIDVRLINDSIVEKEKYPLVYVDVLPYFGHGTTEDVGYAVIPDGSGVLIDFNNDRSFALRYNQRIYGKELARKADVMRVESETLNLPLYGMKINDTGFINIAEEGAEMASIISYISTVDNPYNQTYYRYYIRESETFTFDSINMSTPIVQWTNFYNTGDLALSVKVVDEDSASYSAMAAKYREYLIEKGVLEARDTTTTPAFDLTLLGGYLIKDNFMGFPYTTVRSLTSTEEAQEIIAELLSDNIENINLIYKGWSNDGMKPTYMGRVKYNSSIGTKKDFKALQSYLTENNVEFYPEVYAHTAYTKKGINNNDIVRDVFGKVVKRYGYNEATLYIDTSTLDYYTLKPTTFKDTLTSINNHFEMQGYQNLAFADFGSNNYGHYQKKSPIFRHETLDYFNDAMTNVDFENKNLMFMNPNQYALQYASKITNLPTYGTDYQIIATSIPFYQLVLSGYVDYSSYSFNINDKFSLNWHKMKAIETLSNISMTWSYKSTIDLVETEYSNYYSTYYKNWYDTFINLYNELNSLGIYNSSLVKHELITLNGNITKSIYANGTEIVFNYSDLDYTYNGEVIPKNNFKVVKEAN